MPQVEERRAAEKEEGEREKLALTADKDARSSVMKSLNWLKQVITHTQGCQL